MKLRNKKTGRVVDFGNNKRKIMSQIQEGSSSYEELGAYDTLAEFNEEWEDYKEPLIKDEKIRKAVRAWADVLEIDEVEFYGAKTWIGLRAKNTGTGWSSKFELDYFGSENTLVPFRTYTIAELCGEEE